MRTSILHNWRQLANLEPEWNGLLESSRANTIFLTWEWVQAWRAVVGEEMPLFVITVRNDAGRLVGVAPFYRYRLMLFNSLPFKALRIVADYATASEYGDWFVDPACESQAVDAIAGVLADSREWDVIWMPRMSGWSGALERIAPALRHAGLLYRSRPDSFSRIPLPGSLTEFEESFSAKRRQQLRRNRRNLMSKPGVGTLHCRTPQELPGFLEALFDLHHRRRLLLGDPGCFMRRPAEAEFYRQFAPKALANGWLRIAALTQDDTVQAIQIGYVYDREFLQLQEGFNPDYVDGAGNVLRHIMIEECIHEGLAGYDFLSGLSEHKRRWGAQKRDGLDLMIVRPCLKNRILSLKAIWPYSRFIREEGLYKGN
jgi:CelD/BcsL family acetyltransferase involved in cellulose biosynthesis